MSSPAANRRVPANSLHHLPPGSVAKRKTNPNKWIELTVSVRRLKQLPDLLERRRFASQAEAEWPVQLYRRLVQSRSAALRIGLPLADGIRSDGSRHHGTVINKAIKHSTETGQLQA